LLLTRHSGLAWSPNRSTHTKPGRASEFNKEKHVMKNKNAWIVLSIISLIIVAGMFLPEPIDTDLEKIGNGQKSVVFVYDLNLAVSNQQANEINRARQMIGEQANFLIVKAGDPTRDDFKNEYQTRSADLLFFNGDGELVDRQKALLDAEALVEKISD
jgi:hypothetical protein